MNKWTRPFEWSAASARPAGSSRSSLQHHYFAFLSYSHADRADADWLHGELERFRVPSSLAGRLTANGVIPERLAPIFRDRHDLAAGQDLSTEIREALAASRCLIVLCSPAAAASKWTNAEIETFKRAHPEGCIIAVILTGEPFASERAGQEAEECFPPALRRKYDRRGRATGKRAEPLAADLRSSGDGRRLGLLKIVAGILGVPLDDLVQRDHLRRQRRLAGIAVGSIAGMVAATLLAVTAIDARDEARDQRREAESLVGYMLGDLKDKLQPLGRLDVLDSVGMRALAYYQKQDTSELPDEALIQRSRALTLLGQVASERGDLQSALGYYRAAWQGSQEAMRRSPDDAQRVFDHMQNVFYIGDIARARGDARRAEAEMREYKRLSERLIAIDPANPSWQMEGIYADSNLGVLLNDEGRDDEAAAVFANALADRERLLAAHPANEKYRNALIEMLALLSEARENQVRLGESLALRERQLAMLKPLLASATPDTDFQRQALVAYRSAGRINTVRGRVADGILQLRTAVDIGDRLLADEPANSSWASAATLARFDLARAQLAQGDAATSAALVRDACDSTGRLVARDSTVVDWRFGLRASCLEGRIRVALANKSLDEAAEESGRLIQFARQEAPKAPRLDGQLALANAFMLRGLVERGRSNSAQARRAYQLASATWPHAAPDRPPLVARKALILAGAGRGAEAAALSARLERGGYRDPSYLRDIRLVR